MPSRISDASRRGLVLTAVVLLALLLVVDLLRPDSFVRGLFDDLFSSRSHFRDFLRDMRRQGPGNLFRR